MEDIKINKLVRSGIFKNNSSAAYALAMYHNLSQPNSGPLMDATTGKEYTINNFSEYLIDHCKVEPENTEIALKLLQRLSD